MHFSFSTSSLSSPFFVGNPHPEWRITVKHARERCEREFEKDGCETGLHESLQPCSRAARKWRENEEMKRKRRGNGERMRKWRENFLILPLYPPSLSISYIKICHILSQNVKYGIFVANVTKTEHTRYEEIILGRILCEEAPQVVSACIYPIFSPTPSFWLIFP